MGPKLERKYVEKQRREYMKNLYNHLYSLLPSHHHSSQEALALPDQIDAAINYIKSFNTKLEKRKMHLEDLRKNKEKLQSAMETALPIPSNKSSPRIEIHEMNPTMIVILITNLANLATFHNLVRLCHEEGVEVVCASFSLNGNSMLQISQETKIKGNSDMESRAAILCHKMKELLYGSSLDNDMESQLHLWDYLVESEVMLGFDTAELLPIYNMSKRA